MPGDQHGSKAMVALRVSQGSDLPVLSVLLTKSTFFPVEGWTQQTCLQVKFPM